MTILLASHRLSPDSKIEQPLLNRGLHYGDGLFETLLVHRGRIILKDLHLERLNRDSHRLHISLDIDVVERELNQFITSLPLATEQPVIVKIIVTRGWGGRGYGFTLTDKKPPNIDLLAYDYKVKGDPKVTAIFCQHKIGVNPTLAGIKHLSRLEQVMLSHEVLSKKADEGIVCDSRNNVVEGVSSNIFAMIDGVCCTPILDGAGVAGVMRQHLLQKVLPHLNIPFLETVITIEQLMSAQEIFFTNSIKGLLPVKALNEKSYSCYTVVDKIQNYLQEEHDNAFG